jgi:arylsulfatase A-like enzyme
MLRILNVFGVVLATVVLFNGSDSGHAAAADPAAARPLNVVVIVADDQGSDDYGFRGHKEIKTPRLDRLAGESLTFVNCYTPSSLCRPSLATIITGLYPHEHKIFSNDPPEPLKPVKNKQRDPDWLRLRERQIAHVDHLPTLPRVLAGAGYRSFQTGKWWEGNFRRGGFTHGMTEGSRHGDAGLTIGRESMQPIYDFIDGSLQEQKPFFVWYAPFLPHSPHNPPERLLKKYRDRTPSLEIAKYWAMCEWCDETCGQLLDFLDERKLQDDTLVVYVTDNGWIQDPLADRYAPRSKQSPYDGGLRTPLVLRLPNKIKPRSVDTPVSTIDIAPTVLKACGLTLPSAASKGDIPVSSGIDLLDAAAVAARKQIFGEIFTHSAVDVDDPASSVRFRWLRSEGYKLIVSDMRNEAKGIVELYDLADDPSETKNLAATEPRRVVELTQEIDDWWNPSPTRAALKANR